MGRAALGYNAPARAAFAGRLEVQHCRFRTSWGGASFCRDAPYLEGFCRFHYRALQNGEINEHGVLNERLSDQDRRREINYHGIETPRETYLEERE